MTAQPLLFALHSRPDVGSSVHVIADEADMAAEIQRRWPNCLTMPVPARTASPSCTWLDIWATEEDFLADMNCHDFTRSVGYVEVNHEPGAFLFSPQIWIPDDVRERLAAALGSPGGGRDN
jgi:hypothetical protein